MSKRKPLLTESELHRFMKLANMGPLGNEKLTEMYPAPAVREEDEEGEFDLENAEDDMDHADDLEADAAEDLGDLGDDLGDDLEMGAEGGDVTDITMKLIDAMGEVLAQHGIELTAVETDDAGLEGGDPEIPDAMDDVALDAVEDEVALDDVALEDEEEVMPVMEQEEELEEEAPATQEDIVSEVAKRVRARLKQENKQDKLVDQLAERIMARLTKK